MTTLKPSDLWEEGVEGLYLGLPAEKYHAAAGVNHSMLKNAEPVARLPVYLKEKREPTTAMIMGTLVHQSILEPEKPFPQIVVKPEGMQFRSAADKAWRDEHLKAGRIILNEKGKDSIEQLNGMVSSIKAHPFCNRIFQHGESEVSGFTRQTHGLLRKIRIDWLPHGNALVDIKTVAGEADESTVSKVLYDMRYYTQAAWYLDCWNDLMPEEPRKSFIFIFVEKTAPYLVALYYLSEDKPELDDGTLQLGRIRNAQNLAAIAGARKTGIYHGYCESPQRISIPEYARLKEQEGNL